jgi:hypothetical protein
MKFLLVAIFLSLACTHTGKIKSSLATHQITYNSVFVKDSFDIHITILRDYDKTHHSFPVIYYMDANLYGCQSQIRQIYPGETIDDCDKKGQPVRAIFAGVGHFSSYRVLRRMDFVLLLSETRGIL